MMARSPMCVTARPCPAYIFGHAQFIGGGEESGVALVRGLDRARFDPLAVVPGPGAVAGRLRDAGVRTVEAAMPSPLRHPLRFMRSVVRLARTLRDAGADILHASTSRSALYAALAGRMLNCPVVWHVRESKTDFAPYDLLLALGANRVVCVSAAVRDMRFSRFGPLVRDRLTVIRNGVDAAFFDNTPKLRRAGRERLGAGPDEVLFGMLGSYVPRKGHAFLLRSLARAVGGALPPVRLVLAGNMIDAAVLREVRRLAAVPELHGRVDVFGPHDDPRALLAALDVFVLPSTGEGLSRALMEAMSMGLPVAATDIPETREGAPPPVHALVAPLGDEEAMARILRRLAEDGPLRERMGRANRERAVTRFAIGDHVRRVQGLYEGLSVMCGMACDGMGPRRTPRVRRLARGGGRGLRWAVGAALGLLPRLALRSPCAGRGEVLAVAPADAADMAQALPGLAMLARSVSGGVDVLAHGASAELARLVPGCRVVHGFVRGVSGVFCAARAVRAAGYGVVCDFSTDGALGPPVAARLGGAPCVGLAGGGREREPFLSVAVSALPGPNPGACAFTGLARAVCAFMGARVVPDRSGAAFDAIGGEDDDGAEAVDGAAVSSAVAPLVVVAAGGHSVADRWPAASWADLAAMLGEAGHEVIVVMSGTDGGLARCFRERGTGGYAVMPDVDARTVRGLCRRAALFVGGDSWEMALADVCGVPTVRVLGPLPRWRREPAGRTEALREEDLECLGCGGPDCRIGTHECMRRITPDMVLAAALRVLAADSAGRAAECRVQDEP
ncbi:glycosyltransferase involved in cell wall biosynthesis/ADP-heptose:LPS heptosyltransferase [Desulfobaculum xiamenense]|uniref:Glycosyltransferase involved in cell wall biosynthesis/ADP-heptose:LPS heptosyltransferase n=1 Tax=Desulfobaculum xiamenense TaxID=995050 RepID=A0A846QPW2_9BACT|nr:glycosyltransferase [Desulfobaculum xiamenense]NJB68363.1 glycosyltransferase involved in cell wall biosynthesis/ADP-heptose:LPS heptosyltransferase [Desulfobaculum xiamenense]